MTEGEKIHPLEAALKRIQNASARFDAATSDISAKQERALAHLKGEIASTHEARGFVEKSVAEAQKFRRLREEQGANSSDEQPPLKKTG